jgi:hypothetical protein
MYLPKSQIEDNLISNGDLVFKNNSTPYYGKYFRTSKGKYYANSPTDIVLIELILPPEDKKTLDANNPNSELSDDLRFEGLTNTLYSYLKNAPQKPPVVSSPPSSNYRPTSKERNDGYSIRYFAKKLTSANYIEINSKTFNLFQQRDSSVANSLYEVKSLIWYLTSPGDKPTSEVNFDNVVIFQEKYNWENFENMFVFSGKRMDFFYTKGNELLLPNRTSYIGYYHIMRDEENDITFIMTGKTHKESSGVNLTPLKRSFKPTFGAPDELPNVVSSPSTSTTQGTTSSPSSGGGGGY